MISKIYENKYGLIEWNCITSDLEVAKTDPIYLANKATGSLIINIQEPSNSLIWDNENKKWIPYAVNSGGISNEEVKTLAGEKVQELIDSGELTALTIADKSINASEKIMNGSITQELLDPNINLGGGVSDEEIKSLAEEKVNELISSGTLQSQIITDKSINASTKIINGSITKELLDDNIKLELTEIGSQLKQNKNDISSIKEENFKEIVIEVGNGKQFSTITDALNSIKDNSSKKRYKILVYDGTYKERVVLKEYVGIEAVNKETVFIIWDRDTTTSNDDVYNQSLIELHANGAYIKNITAKGKNWRYIVHTEFNTSVDSEVLIENCYLEHKGNDSQYTWVNTHAIGCG